MTRKKHYFQTCKKSIIRKWTQINLFSWDSMTTKEMVIFSRDSISCQVMESWRNQSKHKIRLRRGRNEKFLKWCNTLFPHIRMFFRFSFIHIRFFQIRFFSRFSFLQILFFTRFSSSPNCALFTLSFMHIHFMHIHFMHIQFFSDTVFLHIQFYTHSVFPQIESTKRKDYVLLYDDIIYDYIWLYITVWQTLWQKPHREKRGTQHFLKVWQKCIHDSRAELKGIRDFHDKSILRVFRLLNIFSI